jgi:hypothetical protein
MAGVVMDYKKSQVHPQESGEQLDAGEYFELRRNSMLMLQPQVDKPKETG